MSKNKFGAFKVGEIVVFNNQKVTIISKQKVPKTSIVNRQSGISTGLKSKPCTYTISTGQTVRGDKFKRITYVK